MKKTISKYRTHKLAQEIVQRVYPELGDVKINIKWQAKESPYIWLIKYGMQRIVQKDGSILIHFPENYMEDPIMTIGRLMHELGHARQIKLGHLKFDGTTYIFHGVRYPLRFSMQGPYEKEYKSNHYWRFKRHGHDVFAPWEQFDSMIRPIAEQFARECGYTVTAEDSAALNNEPDALVKI